MHRTPHKRNGTPVSLSRLKAAKNKYIFFFFTSEGAGSQKKCNSIDEVTFNYAPGRLGTQLAWLFVYEHHLFREANSHESKDCREEQKISMGFATSHVLRFFFCEIYASRVDVACSLSSTVFLFVIFSPWNSIPPLTPSPTLSSPPPATGTSPGNTSFRPALASHESTPREKIWYPG